MGVYIEGMEMPKEGDALFLCVRCDGEVWEVEFDRTIESGFVCCHPTSAVKAFNVNGHGRLIDADALKLRAEQALDRNRHICLVVKTGQINTMPTIIPASEEAT